MKRKSLLVFLALLMSLVAGCQSRAARQQTSQKTPVASPATLVSSPAEPVGGACANLAVATTTTLADVGGNVDWSPDGKTIAYDAYDAQNWTDTWLMNPDGTNKRCLTCGNPAEPTKLHLGNPAWHPSMEWLVVQGVLPSFYQQFPSRDAAYKQRIMDVGVGIGNDLWAMSSDGKRFIRLTDVRSETGFNGGILHAHFSHSGKLLAWAQRIAAIKGDPGGEWAIKLADFALEGGTPRISNVRTFQPQKNTQRLYETHAFSPDDSLLLYSSNSDGQKKIGYDVYTLNIATGQSTRLTHTPDEWDEHAQFSPDGKCIVWASSMNAGSKAGLLKLELWTMAADGSNQKQLTFFNTQSSPMYANDSFGTIPADSTWSSDGKQIAVYVIVNQSAQTTFSMPGRIVILTLK